MEEGRRVEHHEVRARTDPQVADVLAPEEPCVIIGNSAGGALALKLAARGLATAVVAVGSMGHPMTLPPGLDALWSTGPTEAEARALLDLLFYAPPGDDAVAARLEAMRAQPHYRELFPAPRQRWVEAMCTPDDDIRRLQHRTLIIHGREDQVIPVQTSLRLMELIDNADLSVYSHCGHWSMIERNADFNRSLLEFLSN